MQSHITRELWVVGCSFSGRIYVLVLAFFCFINIFLLSWQYIHAFLIPDLALTHQCVVSEILACVCLETLIWLYVLAIVHGCVVVYYGACLHVLILLVFHTCILYTCLFFFLCFHVLFYLFSISLYIIKNLLALKSTDCRHSDFESRPRP